MNKVSKFIILIFVFIFLIASYFLLKRHYEQHKLDINKISSRKTTDLMSAFEGCFESKNWDNLPLSENFRKKYKTKYDITEYAGRFVSYDSGSTYENGEELINIGYQKEYFFDFNDTRGYQIDLYFRYKTTVDGMLDDVELVRMEKSDKMTGRIIED